MAGHSKWKNIQHRKGAQDAKKGKIFTKIAVEITAAARQGGADPDDNPRLRTALAKAKTANMPKENWQRALKKGTGELGGNCDYVERLYEGYSPGGVALLVECLTDNINRTVGDVRYAFSKSGGQLGTDGSVSWMFERKGFLIFNKSEIKDFSKFFEKATELGAEDIEEDETANQHMVTCMAGDFLILRESLEKEGWVAQDSELAYVAKDENIMDEETHASLTKIVNMLEELDDVQGVYHNGRVSS